MATLRIAPSMPTQELNLCSLIARSTPSIVSNATAINKISKNENLIMSTTGYNFEQFNIVKYDGIISGESVIGTGMFSEISASVSDFTGSFSNTFADKIKQAEEQALYNLKRSCYIKNCNAVIGIKLNYLTFSNNMIGVVANGTAVIIEHI